MCEIINFSVFSTRDSSTHYKYYISPLFSRMRVTVQVRVHLLGILGVDGLCSYGFYCAYCQVGTIWPGHLKAELIGLVAIIFVLGNTCKSRVSVQRQLTQLTIIILSISRNFCQKELIKKHLSAVRSLK